MQKRIEKVAIVGGTHGNELTGVYLVNKFKANLELVKRESFETIVMHANLKAIEQCRRYIDNDLNRTFDIYNLEDPAKGSYEDLLAKLINQKLGPKGAKKPEVDFIVDLHSTTSNMGLSIVLDNASPLAWQAAAYLKEKEPRVNLFRWKGDTDNAPFVDSISKHGFAIEVGAVPQGVLRADLFFDTEKLIHHLLDFFERTNKGEFVEPYKSVEIYDFVGLVDFPRDELGNIVAMLSPSLQDNDYRRLQKGDPFFVTLDGEVIPYERDEALCALFVNEAAYYEKGFAVCLAKKKTIEI